MTDSKISYLKAMKRLNTAIPEAKDLQEGLQTGLDIILEDFGFEYAVVWYPDKSGDRRFFAQHTGWATST